MHSLRQVHVLKQAALNSAGKRVCVRGLEANAGMNALLTAKIRSGALRRPGEGGRLEAHIHTCSRSPCEGNVGKANAVHVALRSFSIDYYF